MTAKAGRAAGSLKGGLPTGGLRECVDAYRLVCYRCMSQSTPRFVELCGHARPPVLYSRGGSSPPVRQAVRRSGNISFIQLTAARVGVRTAVSAHSAGNP